MPLAFSPQVNGLIIFLVFFWTLGGIALGALVAQSRGRGVGQAALLGLLLGWLGFLVVVVWLKPAATAQR